MQKIIFLIVVFISVFFISFISLIILDGKNIKLFLEDKNVVENINYGSNVIKNSSNLQNKSEEKKNCSSNQNETNSCSIDFPKNNNEEEKKNDFVKEVKELELENLAKDFELLNLNNEKIKLSDYRGKKPVIVEFWNSWCHNCQREMPKLEKIYRKYNRKFEIIGINLLDNNDSKEKVDLFVKKYYITFPIVFDEKLLTAVNYDVRATNTHFLINKDGTIYDSFFVDLKEEKLKDFLKFNGIELE